jgi:hypothetical protein
MAPEQCPIAQDKLFLERIRFGSIFDLNEMRFHTGKDNAPVCGDKHLTTCWQESSRFFTIRQKHMINYTISLISPRLPEAGAKVAQAVQ